MADEDKHLVSHTSNQLKDACTDGVSNITHTGHLCGSTYLYPFDLSTSIKLIVIFYFRYLSPMVRINRNDIVI